MRHIFCFLLGLALFAGCGSATGASPASVAGTWSILELDSGCPMFEPDSFVVSQTGRSVSAQFVDGAGNLCSLAGTYEPDRFVGTFRVEEPTEGGRVITLDVDAYARTFGVQRTVDGWLRVASDTAGQCVGDIVEFCATILGDSPANEAPTLVLLDPDDGFTVPVGTPVTIRYVDDDPDSNATTRIYARSDGNEILIATRVDGNGAAQTVTWDTTGVPPGSYTIEGETTDGVSTVTARAPDGVTLTGGSTNPALRIQGGPLTFCPGGVLEIVYADDDVGPTTLYADPDGDLSTTAGQIVIAADRPDGNGAQQTVLWDTAGAPLGSYVIVARAAGGLTASRAGTITLVAPAALVSAAMSETSSPGEAFADGSYVVSGGYVDGAPFTLGAGEANETTFTTIGDGDMYVARYNADGTLRWARTAASQTSNSHSSGGAVATFSDGSFVMSTGLRGTVTFAEGEVNETTLVSDGVNDIVYIKYDADGNMLWVRQDGGPGQDQGGGIAGYVDGSFIAAGYLGNGVAVFGKGEANETSFDVVNGFDIFIARYDADGKLIWVRREDSPEMGSDLGAAVVGFADGSCVVSSRRYGRPLFGQGDHWIARYDADGAQLWERAIDATNAIGFVALAGFADGSFAATFYAGFYSPTMTFGAGDPNETTVDTVRNDDSFINRYNADGTLAWALQIGGRGSERATSVVTFPDGSLAASGTFEQTATVFGNGVTWNLTSLGEGDVYIVHVDATGNPTCVRQYGGPGADSAGLRGFADGSLLAVGRFEDSITLGAGEAAATTLTSAGGFGSYRAVIGPVGE